MMQITITQEEIARRSEVAPRTVARYVHGQAIRPASARRIARTLAELGLFDRRGELDAGTRAALGISDTAEGAG
jgi:transcriptional regulator with XRE-family HTH domain